ncbi:cytosol aminopeptidase-like [Leguminivora glycinivorella]|uniref:cytosol aminopeptidase-like n=1 Tax=Leguminivora glycinivorella TaxID=1035111 RepID=UPI00200C2721|nr:cytosol aminopeptidase-like [Leguminivora glycinivorella]
MGLSKLLFSSRYLQNGVGYMGRRLLASEAGHPPCESQESAKSAGSAGAVNRKAAVCGVYQTNGGYELSEWAAQLDAESGNKLTKQLNVLGADFKVGQAVVVSDVGQYEAVALSSFGPKEAAEDELEGLHEGKENVRWGIGAGHKVLSPYGFHNLQTWYDPGQHPDASAESFTLAEWKFDKFRHRPPLPPGGQIPVESDDGKEGQIRGQAQNWARYLSDMPANKMTPTDVAQEAIDVLCPLGVRVTAHDRHWIEANNMQAFLTVARGSCEPPIFLECEYKGLESGNTILMAAKGVTFDSGGLCLKRPADMIENRGSMAGAAAALGAIQALARLKAKVNVSLVVPLCENMISGQCMKVGDIVPALNGLNIQIEDTDMEGRLMLADALVYGQAKYRPYTIVDVATLTHGIKMATGGGCYGCFSNKEWLWECAKRAGAISGDRPWRFPLWDYYKKQIVDDPSVDLRNRGSGKATPCIGAAFLQQFVCADWLHFDITGVGKLAHDPPPYLCSKRMSGRPTRALTHTLMHIAHYDDKCRNKHQ